MAHALLWNQTEAQKAKTGIIPMQAGRSEDVYRAWVHECDARKACALLIGGDSDKSSVDDLMKIRAYLFRGDLQKANEAIREYALKNSSSDEALFEANLEESRLAAFQGDWVNSNALAEKALGSGKLESLSYLSALQVHALGCFELGRFTEALNSLQMADALSAIYPFSVSSFYAKTLQGRILARTQSITQGLTWLDRIWDQFRDKDRHVLPNADFVHALVFAIIDVLKYARVSHHSIIFHKLLERLTLASYSLTEVTGELLYSSLACADAAVCGPEQNRGWFLKQIQSSRSDLQRIERLLKSWESSEPANSSETIFTALMQETSGKIGNEAPMPSFHLFFSQQKWIFQLKPWNAIDLSVHPQLVVALRSLSKGPSTKEKFFNEVWGNARYTSRLHDASIQYVLSRIKKITGARCKVRDGLITLDQGIITL